VSRGLPNSRQRLRRVYGGERAPSDKIVFVEASTNITRSFDASQMQVHRDFYIVFAPSSSQSPVIPPPAPVYGEYDEDLIDFNWQSEATKTFNITFSSTPIVTLEVENLGTGLEGVQPFLVSYTNGQLTVGLSAIHSGSIRYRAIYASSYPSVVVRNVLEPTLYYTASAGSVDLTGQSEFTATYSPVTSPPTAPSQVFFGLYDINGNNEANVSIAESGSFGVAITQGYLTSYLNNRVNYMAVK
jgi:hypothetical protein